MKAKEILTELEELERKRNEIDTVLKESSFGEPEIILQDALDKYQKKIDTFLNSEFEPTQNIVYLGVTPNPVVLTTNDTVQLIVTATFNDGTTEDVSLEKVPLMLFRDFDNNANNVGYILSVDVSKYTGKETTFNIIKTNNGFDVDDSQETQGLHVLATIVPNEYTIVDKEGKPIGINFVMDGAEVTGDNWLIDLYWTKTGTTYIVDNPALATVSSSGLITGISGGNLNVQIQNGLHLVTVPVTIIDNIAPDTPTITSVAPMVESAEVTFTYSNAPDVKSYNIYVDGVKTMTNIQLSPVLVTPLVADDITSYKITVTAVDNVGNESIESNAESVVPLTSTL
ncbi:hypothetical protein [Metabacillus fastidiosus]|uniref:hypothetical protein n=1 Tax=Metabacillus fastidiosus TaxID=1458 RepID=UPI003D2D8511